MAQKKQNKVTFTFDKTTKNGKLRFTTSATPVEQPVGGTLYLPKGAIADVVPFQTTITAVIQ